MNKEFYTIAEELAKDFDCVDKYIEVLEKNMLIYDGCADCMREYGTCQKAMELYRDNAKVVDCQPMSYMSGNKYFPAVCLKDWFGGDILYCPHCCEIIPYEKWDYDENNNKICLYCENELEEI